MFDAYINRRIFWLFKSNNIDIRQIKWFCWFYLSFAFYGWTKTSTEFCLLTSSFIHDLPDLGPSSWVCPYFEHSCYMSRDMTKPTKWLCAQRRLRSAWASAQSDQSLRCALNGYLRTQAFFMRTAKTLIRLSRYPGWSEYSLGTQSLCWFCHVAAHEASD